MKSLPAWECGLKYLKEDTDIANPTSLPAWECGLKFEYYHCIALVILSLPAWECGLKYRTIWYNIIITSHSLRGSVD